MLLEFRFENFRSFYEENVISMIKTRKTELSDTLITNEKLNIKLLPTLVIYGSNSAGKTNIIMAQNILKQLVLNRSITNTNDSNNIINEIPFYSFIHEKDKYEKPMKFDISFIYNDTKYEYILKLKNFLGDKLLVSKIVYEELLVNDIYMFRREQNEVSLNKTKYALKYYEEGSDPSYSSKLKTLEENLNNNMSDDMLFSSWYSTINKKVVLDVYEWFSKKYNIYYDFNEMPYRISAVDGTDIDNKEIHNSIFDIFGKAAEIGPQEINLQVRKESDKQETQFVSIYQMKWDNGGIRIRIPSNKMESKGTLKLFKFMVPFLSAISNGETIVIDELDSSIHPEIIAGLIKVFKNPLINKNGAQLIFNTHNPIYLNKNLFRRDEIVFVEREKDTSQSIAYTLAEIQTGDGKGIRSDEEYVKNYMSGKYGAIPIIDFEYTTEKLLNAQKENSDE